MTTETTNYQCPSCDAPLKYVGESGRLECEYCDSSFEVAFIETLYAEQRAKAEEQARRKQERRSDEQSREGADASAGPSNVKTYVCSSCGAELVCDLTTAVSECPYCGNQAVAPGVLSGDFKPDLVIPFKLGKDKAVAALKSYYRGKKFLPREFADSNHVEKVQGVYAPFWLYDARAQGEARFEATRTRVRRSRDCEIVETDHFNVFREGSMEFERVPVDGSVKMSDAHMDAIEPFDYTDLRPFSMAYLPGFAADRFDVDEEQCKARAHERMSKSVANALEQTVVGYDSVILRDCRVDASWDDPSYALLPVWMLHTTWNGTDYLFAMNGQTGKIVGNLPVSAPKLIAWFVGVYALVLLATAAIVFGIDLLGDQAANAVIACLIPAVASGALCYHWRKQMKTAVERDEADAYLQQETFRLGRSDDAFTHTTRVERRIEHHHGRP